MLVQTVPVVTIPIADVAKHFILRTLLVLLLHTHIARLTFGQSTFMTLLILPHFIALFAEIMGAVEGA